MKLPAQRAGLPGHAVASRMRANEMSFLIVPLDPAYKAGLAGHLPVKVQSWESLENWKHELRAKGDLGNRPLKCVLDLLIFTTLGFVKALFGHLKTY